MTDQVGQTGQTGLAVLFVCTANICRSPYMELAARHYLTGAGQTGIAIEIASAGTLGFVDSPMDKTMAGTLGEIDPSRFLSRRLTPALVDAADLVLTATDEHRQFILLEQPTAYRKVFALGQFARAVERLAAEGGEVPSGAALVEAVGHLHGVAQLRADVADPYRRGRRAAAACAREIDGMLATVLPALAGRNPAP